MKLLLSAYACLPNAGTEPGHGWGTATYLARRGIEVHVLTQFENKDRIEDYLRDNPIERLHFCYLDHSLNRLDNDGLRYLLWQYMAVRKARELHHAVNFDLAHHITYGSFHVPTQLWRVGIPVIFGPVGGGQVASESMLSYFGADKVKERRRTLFTKLIRYSPFHRHWLKQMSEVYVVNRDTMNLAQELGRSDAKLMFDTIIPDGFLAPEPRHFEGQPQPLRILWVGRMVPRKGLLLSLDMLVKVKTDFTLTIVGNGIDAPKVKKMIDERGLTERVFWQDRRLPWVEVRAAYLSHDVLLFNSLRETGGAQLVEAMALGLPIITLNSQGPRDLVPSGAGLKIEVESPSQVVTDGALTIDRFSALSAMARTEMSRVGWEFASELTYSKRAELLETIYRRVVAQTHPSEELCLS